MQWIVGVLETAGQQGLLFGLVALSVAISYRVLDFPDLTVDGSLPLGAALAATLIAGGQSPILATVAAVAAGAAAGAVTGTLNAVLGISRILSGILVMTLLYSVSLRIMGRPNISLLTSTTVLTRFEDLGWPHHLGVIAFYGVLAAIVALVLNVLFLTNFGLLLRATGNNDRSVLAAGASPGALRVKGLAIANALTAFAGAIMAQSFGFADIGMGVGTLVTGFASLLIGETLIRPRNTLRLTMAALFGAFLYQAIIAALLRQGLAPTDLKLATGAVVILLLAIQHRGKRATSTETT